MTPTRTQTRGTPALSALPAETAKSDQTPAPAPAAPADPLTTLLDEPLDQRRIRTRIGAGNKRLSYISQEDAKRTANRIFGYAGWSYRTNDLALLGQESLPAKNGRAGLRVAYRATVTVAVHMTGKVVERQDVGYGDAVEYGAVLTLHELACKEAVSDAVKRCLASFGDQFGLSLYGEDPAPPDPEPEPVVSADDLKGLAALCEQAGQSVPDLRDRVRRQLAEHPGGVPVSWFQREAAALASQAGHSAAKAAGQ